MSLCGYCTESEKQSGCLGPEWLWVYRVFTLVITWLPGSRSCCPAQHPEREILPNTTNSGKDTNSKFEVWLLLNECHLRTILRLNHRKLGNVCISQDKFLEMKWLSQTIHAFHSVLDVPSWYRRSSPIYTSICNVLLYILHMPANTILSNSLIFAQSDNNKKNAIIGSSSLFIIEGEHLIYLRSICKVKGQRQSGKLQIINQTKTNKPTENWTKAWAGTS